MPRNAPNATDMSPTSTENHPAACSGRPSARPCCAGRRRTGRSARATPTPASCVSSVPTVRRNVCGSRSWIAVPAKTVRIRVRMVFGTAMCLVPRRAQDRERDPTECDCAARPASRPPPREAGEFDAHTLGGSPVCARTRRSPLRGSTSVSAPIRVPVPRRNWISSARSGLRGRPHEVVRPRRSMSASVSSMMPPLWTCPIHRAMPATTGDGDEPELGDLSQRFTPPLVRGNPRQRPATSGPPGRVAA